MLLISWNSTLNAVAVRWSCTNVWIVQRRQSSSELPLLLWLRIDPMWLRDTNWWGWTDQVLLSPQNGFRAVANKPVERLSMNVLNFEGQENNTHFDLPVALYEGGEDEDMLRSHFGDCNGFPYGPLFWQFEKYERPQHFLGTCSDCSSRSDSVRVGCIFCSRPIMLHEITKSTVLQCRAWLCPFCTMLRSERGEHMNGRENSHVARTTPTLFNDGHKVEITEGLATMSERTFKNCTTKTTAKKQCRWFTVELVPFETGRVLPFCDFSWFGVHWTTPIFPPKMSFVYDGSPSRNEAERMWDWEVHVVHEEQENCHSG